MQPTSVRNYSIDSFRFLAICLVVMLHTAANVQGTSSVGIFLNQLARFAVPFFFMASGFFFYQKAIKNPNQVFSYLLSYGSRILLIYLVWYMVYALWPLYSPANWGEIARHGIGQEFSEWLSQLWSQFKAHMLYFLLGGGRGFHLWFLPSLGMGIFLLALSLRLDLFVVGSLLAALLFLVALLVGPYRHTFAGLHFAFEPRNGPFFSSLFVFIGAAFAKYAFRVSITAALCLALFGLLLSLAEVFFIHYRYGLPMNLHNFVVGTVVYAAGVMLIALSNNKLGLSLRLHELGKLALGIYVSHVLVMWIMQAFQIWPSNNFFRFSSCLLLSVLLTKALIMIPGVRKVIC